MANTEGRGKSKIWKPEIGYHLFDERFHGRHVGHLFAEVDVKDSASGVLCLQVILKRKGLENVVCEIDRELG